MWYISSRGKVQHNLKMVLPLQEKKRLISQCSHITLDKLYGEWTFRSPICGSKCILEHVKINKSCGILGNSKKSRWKSGFNPATLENSKKSRWKSGFLNVRILDFQTCRINPATLGNSKESRKIGFLNLMIGNFQELRD